MARNYRPATSRSYKSSTSRAYRPATSRTYKHSSGKKGKSWANKISEFLLGTNKFVRDINALQKGSIADRIGRRIAGKGAGSFIGKIFGR